MFYFLNEIRVFYLLDTGPLTFPQEKGVLHFIHLAGLHPHFVLGWVRLRTRISISCNLHFQHISVDLKHRPESGRRFRGFAAHLLVKMPQIIAKNNVLLELFLSLECPVKLDGVVFHFHVLLMLFLQPFHRVLHVVQQELGVLSAKQVCKVFVVLA